jgi:hypothetical protein
MVSETEFTTNTYVNRRPQCATSHHLKQSCFKVAMENLVLRNEA